MLNSYAGSLFESLADGAVAAAAKARVEAGTATWGRTETGWVLLSRVEGERAALAEIVHYPGEGDDLEVSDLLMAEAGL